MEIKEKDIVSGYFKGWLEGIKKGVELSEEAVAKSTMQANWIDINTKKPKEGEQVLVYCPVMDEITYYESLFYAAIFFEDEFFVIDDNYPSSKKYINYVSHWMELAGPINVPGEIH